MIEISKLNINGTTYDIKDATARQAAEDAVKSHEQLLNKTTEEDQEINSLVKFNKVIVLANGATITDTSDAVYFSSPAE